MGPKVYIWDLKAIYESYRLRMGPTGYIWDLKPPYVAYRLHKVPVSYVSSCKKEGRMTHRTMKVCGICELTASIILNVDAEW